MITGLLMGPVAVAMLRCLPVSSALGLCSVREVLAQCVLQLPLSCQLNFL